MLERRSSLADSPDSGRDGSDGRRRVRIGERRDWWLWQVADFPGSPATCEPDLCSALGAVAHPRAGVVTHAGPHRILLTGVRQYWIITRDEDVLRPALQKLSTARAVAITALSHSRTCICLQGPAARDVLAASVPLDLHPDVFAEDACALTGMHHTPVLLMRVGADAYEIYAMRTFARFVRDHLVDSALPYGYDMLA